jgi:ADP-heptose:LPS heptosyltransferase
VTQMTALKTKITVLLEDTVNKCRAWIFAHLDSVLLSLLAESDLCPGRVLIVRLDAIGDFVVWLDAAKALRNLYPEGKYKLVLLGNHLWTPLAEELKLFDEVWSLDRRKFSKNISYRISLLKKVRAGGFETAVHPTFSRDFMFGDTIIKATCARERIGSESDGFNLTPSQKRRSDLWYTRLVPAAQVPVMELIRNADFIRGLGNVKFKAGVPTLPVQALSPVHLGSFYVLVPGAGAKLRQWPVESFVQLAGKIYRATGWTGVVCGGAGETVLGDAIEKSAGVPIENWAGKTSLRELVAVIAKACVVVGNETSAIHISAAVSTPSVCIVGGGHFGRFVPYKVEDETTRPLPAVCFHPMECFGCNWQCGRCSKSEMVAPCITKVTVDDVWEVVARVIEGESLGRADSMVTPHRRIPITEITL